VSRMRVSRLLPLLVALPGTLAGQPLSRRVQSVREGTVRFSYASRPGLCGDGRDAVRTGPVMVVLPSVVSYGHSDIDVCLTGPVRVAIGRSNGESVSYRVHVGGRWNASDDASDLGVLLQRTNGNFQNLSKTNGEDLTWDADGVRYAQDAKNLKITWVIDPDFLHSMHGHPTHVFKGKLTLFDIDIVRNQAIPKALLSKNGFKAVGDNAPRSYQLDKNGWKINIVADQDRRPEAVTLEHLSSPG